jgi:hypothetical protein
LLLAQNKMDRRGTRRGFWTDGDVKTSAYDVDEDAGVDRECDDREVEEALGELQQLQEIPGIEGRLHNLFGNLQKFWQEHKNGFVEMWECLSGMDRKRLIMCVSPHITVARSNPRCACGGNCDLKLLAVVAPELNIDDLIGGGRPNSSDLIQLLDEMTTDEVQNYLGDALYIRHACRTSPPDPRKEIIIDNMGIAGKRGSGMQANNSAPPQAQQQLIDHVQNSSKRGIHKYIHAYTHT